MQHLEQKDKVLRISNIIIVDMLTLPETQEGMGEYDKAEVTEAYHSLLGKSEKLDTTLYTGFLLIFKCQVSYNDRGRQQVV